MIRCTWPNDINGHVQYTRSSNKNEVSTDCRYDLDLVTISRHGCTISPMNPNIHYHLMLYQNETKIDSILDFDPRQFRKYVYTKIDSNQDLKSKLRSHQRTLLPRDRKMVKFICTGRMTIERWWWLWCFKIRSFID